MFKRLRGPKLILDFAILSGGQLLSKIAGFVAFAYLARVMGPKSYGSVEYGMGLAVFFSMVIDFGLGPVGVRELATEEEPVDELTANITVARLALVAICIPIMLLAAMLSHPSDEARTLVWLYALSLLACPWKLEWLFQARDMMNAAAAGQLIRMGLFAAGVLLIVKVGTPVYYAGWLEVGAAALTSLYYLAMQHFFITRVSLSKVSLQVLKRLVKEGIGVGGGQMVSAVNIYAPLLLVATLIGGDETGWFGAAHRVVASLSTFSMLYHFNIYPVIARRLAAGGDSVDEVIVASLRVVSWVSIGGALALTLLGTQLMVLAYGPKFAGAGLSFKLLVWFLPLTLLSGHARWFMIAAKRQHFVFVAQVGGAVASVAAGIPLVKFLGPEGAAATMVVGAAAVWVVAQYCAVTRVRKIAGVSLSLLPAGLALLAGFVAWKVPGNRWLVTAGITVTYFALAPLLDRNLLRDLGNLARAKSDLRKAA